MAKKKSLKKKRKPIFVNFAMPLAFGGKKTHATFLIEARHMQRAIDTLYKLTPGKRGRLHLLKELQEVLRYNKVNWHGFILFAEILGIGPGKAYGLLGEHFKRREMQKLRVGFLNQILVKSLLKKIDQWGKTPAAWKNHRAYINSWCKRTGTPLFKSYSNFSDYVTAWRDATVGKIKYRERMKKNVTQYVDRPFSIFNKPPKS